MSVGDKISPVPQPYREHISRLRMKKAQEADARLLKQNPLPITHKRYAMSTEEFNLVQRSSPSDKSGEISEARLFDSMQLKHIPSIREEDELETDYKTDEIADVDNQDLNSMKSQMLHSRPPEGSSLEERLAFMEEEMNRQKKEFEQFKDEYRQFVADWHKKFTEKLKILYENQQSLDRAIHSIQNKYK